MRVCVCVCVCVSVCMRVTFYDYMISRNHMCHMCMYKTNRGLQRQLNFFFAWGRTDPYF